MKAFVIHELTGPDGGTLCDIDEPEGSHAWAGGERLLIDVHAAGVSFPDVLQSRGEYQHVAAPPYASGSEVAGVVLEAPEGSSLQRGDRVVSLTMWGAMAERALGLPRYTIKIPPTMKFAEGAAFYLNYATAWFSLYRTQARAGETILVHGAAGGVGTATIQVTLALGMRPIAVVSSEDKEKVAREAGAEVVVRSDSDWVAAAKDLTDGRGVDVVVDPVGGDRMTDSLRSLDVGGRVAVVGFAAGEIPSIKANRLLLRDLSVVGVALAPYAERYPDVLVTLNEALRSMAERGVVKPVIGHRLPLEDGAAALRLIDDRRALGKVIVEVKPERTEA